MINPLFKIGSRLLGDSIRKLSFRIEMKEDEELLLTLPCYLAKRRTDGNTTEYRRGHIAITNKRFIYKGAGFFEERYDSFSDTPLKDFTYQTDTVGAWATKKNSIVFEKQYMGKFSSFVLKFSGNGLKEFEEAVSPYID